MTSHHTASAAALAQAGLLRLDTQDQTGQDYLADATWARDYADRNRLAILAAVERILAEMFQVQLDTDSTVFFGMDQELEVNGRRPGSGI